MEAPDDFYVELPSNIDSALFPENTHGHYRVQLARALVLSEKFEVALVETFFLRNWFNIMKDDGEITIIRSIAGNKDEELKTHLEEGYYDRPETLVQDISRRILKTVSSLTVERMRETFIEAKAQEEETKQQKNSISNKIKKLDAEIKAMNDRYAIENKKANKNVAHLLTLQEEINGKTVQRAQDVEQLTKANTENEQKVNARYRIEKELKTKEEELKSPAEKLKTIAHEKKLPYFQYSSGKVDLFIPAGISIKLAPRLRHILGFTSTTSLENVDNLLKIVRASRAIDLGTDINSLCIYSNIVQPQFLGNMLVPLLRIVHIDDNDGVRITKTYPQPFYRPVSLNYIDIIEIDIRDMYGRQIHFTDGDVVVNKLHFRHRSK